MVTAHKKGLHFCPGSREAAGTSPVIRALLASLGQTPLSLSWGFLLSQFLALDTQMLMGNRRYSLSPEEYIFGALNIYLDIIYIFSFFLQFFGSSQE